MLRSCKPTVNTKQAKHAVKQKMLFGIYIFKDTSILYLIVHFTISLFEQMMTFKYSNKKALGFI